MEQSEQSEPNYIFWGVREVGAKECRIFASQFKALHFLRQCKKKFPNKVWELVST